MRALLLGLLLATPTSAADKSPLAACLKWTKDAPAAQAAGEKAFASFRRVEGAGPWSGCDAVAVVDDFGVGWFMRAYMKPSVRTACGERLGAFSFHYKDDAWQEKLVAGLRAWLDKNPDKLKAAKACAEAPKP